MKIQHGFWVLPFAGLVFLLAGCGLQGASSSDSEATSLSVGISKPAQGAYVNSGEVEVKASASRGTVESVQVSYAGPQTGTINLSPAGGVWRGSLPADLPSGAYTLRAQAKVGSVEKQSDSVPFTLDRDPPSVTFLEPTSPVVTQGSSTLTVRVRAQDSLSGISTVRFFAGNQLLDEGALRGGDEYVFSADTATLPSGTVLLRAVAQDRAGNTQEASIQIDRTPPTVVWTRPADGSVVSGLVQLEVEATDNVGVAKVEFYAGSTKLGEDISAPYTLNWDTTRYADGQVTLKARAVDGAGNVQEATLQVTLANVPRISWISPAPNQQVAGSVTLEVEVQAPRGVSKVEFYFGPDENSLAKIPGTPTVSGNRYTLQWNVLRVEPGSYLLKAVVTDSLGSRSEASIPVVVGATFVISVPAEGDQVGPGAQRAIVTVTVGINGTLPPGVSVSRVEVYINGQLQGPATSSTAGDGSQVFIYTWDTTRSSPGHDPAKSGDRIITARIYYTGGDTWTNGVRVAYRP